MKFPWPISVFQKSRERDGAVILIYHRVARLTNDPQLLAVSPANFAAQLDALRDWGSVVPLAELVERVRRAAPVDRLAAITFDDGYADNLLEAEGVLASRQMHATFFISTALLQTDREFYWDELDRLLLQPGSLPDRLELQVGPQRLIWELGSSATYTALDYQRDAGWSVAIKGDPTPRHRAYRELCPLLKQMPDMRRQDVLGEVRHWAGSQAAGRATHRMMSHDELRQLAASPIAALGAHTHTHPALSTLPPSEQLQEIDRSASEIQSWTGKAPLSFSYPFGGVSDYTAQTVKMVRDRGFTHACANFDGRVRGGADVFQLPRMLVRNWDAAEFGRCLARRSDA